MISDIVKISLLFIAAKAAPTTDLTHHETCTISLKTEVA